MSVFVNSWSKCWNQYCCPKKLAFLELVNHWYLSHRNKKIGNQCFCLNNFKLWISIKLSWPVFVLIEQMLKSILFPKKTCILWAFIFVTQKQWLNFHSNKVLLELQFKMVTKKLIKTRKEDVWIIATLNF